LQFVNLGLFLIVTGTTIDQGIAYILMLVALGITYMIHWFLFVFFFLLLLWWPYQRKIQNFCAVIITIIDEIQYYSLYYILFILPFLVNFPPLLLHVTMCWEFSFLYSKASIFLTTRLEKMDPW